MNRISCDIIDRIYIPNNMIKFFDPKYLYNVNLIDDIYHVQFNYEIFKTIYNNNENMKYYCRAIALRSNEREVRFHIVPGGDNEFNKNIPQSNILGRVVMDQIRYTEIIRRLGMPESLYNVFVNANCVWFCEILQGILYNLTMFKS